MRKFKNYSLSLEPTEVELENFGKLESKIRTLLEDHLLLKKKNQELEGLLRKKDGEIEGANSEIRRLQEEKDAIRTKVDSLLEILKDVGVPR